MFLPKISLSTCLSLVECKAVRSEKRGHGLSNAQLLEAALELGAGLVTECVAFCHFPIGDRCLLGQRKNI